VPRKHNYDLEKQIKKAVHDLRLQPEESFILKVGNIRPVHLLNFILPIVSLIITNLITTNCFRTVLWSERCLFF